MQTYIVSYVIQYHTFVILRPVEAEDPLFHFDGAPNLVADSVRGNGHLGHHGVRLSEQPHVPIMDRPVAGQTALISVFLVEGGVSDEGSQDLVRKPDLGNCGISVVSTCTNFFILRISRGHVKKLAFK